MSQNLKFNFNTFYSNIYWDLSSPFFVILNIPENQHRADTEKTGLRKFLMGLSTNILSTVFCLIESIKITVFL